MFVFRKQTEGDYSSSVDKFCESIIRVIQKSQLVRPGVNNEYFGVCIINVTTVSGERALTRRYVEIGLNPIFFSRCRSLRSSSYFILSAPFAALVLQTTALHSLRLLFLFARLSTRSRRLRARDLNISVMPSRRRLV